MRGLNFESDNLKLLTVNCSVILSPSRNPSDLKRLFDNEPRGNVKFIVFLFDEDGLSVGQKVILDMSSFSDVMAIKRYLAYIVSHHLSLSLGCGWLTTLTGVWVSQPS